MPPPPPTRIQIKKKVAGGACTPTHKKMSTAEREGYLPIHALTWRRQRKRERSVKKGGTREPCCKPNPKRHRRPWQQQQQRPWGRTVPLEEVMSKIDRNDLKTYLCTWWILIFTARNKREFVFNLQKMTSSLPLINHARKIPMCSYRVCLQPQIGSLAHKVLKIDTTKTKNKIIYSRGRAACHKNESSPQL